VALSVEVGPHKTRRGGCHDSRDATRTVVELVEASRIPSVIRSTTPLGKNGKTLMLVRPSLAGRTTPPSVSMLTVSGDSSRGLVHQVTPGSLHSVPV
jgi:hypothetical protein